MKGAKRRSQEMEKLHSIAAKGMFSSVKDQMYVKKA